jgi:hypothetical protein
VRHAAAIPEPATPDRLLLPAGKNGDQYNEMSFS